jgi:hypothetical protein
MAHQEKTKRRAQTEEDETLLRVVRIRIFEQQGVLVEEGSLGLLERSPCFCSFARAFFGSHSNRRSATHYIVTTP